MASRYISPYSTFSCGCLSYLPRLQLQDADNNRKININKHAYITAGHYLYLITDAFIWHGDTCVRVKLLWTIADKGIAMAFYQWTLAHDEESFSRGNLFSIDIT
ncbi:hypothetical protein MAR_034342, partial [Mya arenaria]